MALKLFSFCVSLVLMVMPVFAAETYTASEYSFTSWCKFFKRNYCSPNSTEFQTRLPIWLSNLNVVDSHNILADNGLETFWLAQNEFSDITNQEYQEKMLRPRSFQYIN